MKLTAKQLLEKSGHWGNVSDDNLTKKVLIEFAEEYAEIYHKQQIKNNGSLGGVSGSLPITDNDHLNELIKIYNKDKYELIKFIELVWNNAHSKGYWKGHENK